MKKTAYSRLSDCRKSHILTGRRVTPYSVGRCPKDRGDGHPLGAPSPTDGYFTYYECRGELCSPANNNVYRQSQRRHIAVFFSFYLLK